jgi:ABC-type Fe3+ transport system substrate-binding protein
MAESSRRRGLTRRNLIGGAAMVAVPSIIGRVAHAEDDWQAGGGAEWTKLLAAARRESSVVLGAPGIAGQAMAEPLKRDTGITLELQGGTPTAITSRVQAELQANHVTVDVLLGGQAELAFLDRLAPLDDLLLLPKVKDGRYWRDGRIKWVDNEGRRMLQATEYVGGWLIVNAEAVKAGEIVSWKELLDPKYRERIGAADPLTPGAGFAAATWLIDLFGADFITELFLQQKIAYTPDTNLLVEWIARKKYDIAVGGIQASLEKFRAEGFKDSLRPMLPQDGPGYVTGGYSVVKMPQGVPHPNAAAVFLNWYLSAPGQAAYSTVMLESSRRTDVPLNRQLDYLVPRPGVKYVDVYNETSYRKRPAQLAALTAALKR